MRLGKVIVSAMAFFESPYLSEMTGYKMPKFDIKAEV